MNTPDLPKVVDIPPKMQKQLGPGTLLIPSATEIEEFIRSLPEGRLATISEVRSVLAQKHLADTTCPLVTGIHLRIVAEAAEERGGENMTPYWRVVRDDGKLNPKWPGGVESQAKHLRAEGHRIMPAKGKQPPRVILH